MYIFLILIQINVYFLFTFLSLIEVNAYFFIELFLSLIEAIAYFLFIINLVLIFKKNMHWLVLMIKRSIKNILSSIMGEVNEPVFFFTKHILSLKHTKQ